MWEGKQRKLWAIHPSSQCTLRLNAEKKDTDNTSLHGFWSIPQISHKHHLETWNGSHILHSSPSHFAAVWWELHLQLLLALNGIWETLFSLLQERAGNNEKRWEDLTISGRHHSLCKGPSGTERGVTQGRRKAGWKHSSMGGCTTSDLRPMQEGVSKRGRDSREKFRAGNQRKRSRTRGPLQGEKRAPVGSAHPRDKEQQSSPWPVTLSSPHVSFFFPYPWTCLGPWSALSTLTDITWRLKKKISKYGLKFYVYPSAFKKKSQGEPPLF